MGTAKQLIPTFVDAQPIVWNRDFVQNMRHIRGYPNWWRIRDDQSFIDGPPTEGEQYTRELFIWRAEIVKDESDENTDTLELYNLAEFLTVTEEVVDGETIYSYKYRDTLPALSYTHTDVIDSVSSEFDQLGRRMVAFESMGDVFLLWYDSQAGGTVVTNWGAGYNPQIVTDTYRRTGGSADSERLLFYVDSTTKQIVYRKQLDRFGVVYTLPSAPQDVVELLKVSKNLYGGLTVLYCYEESPGVLTTGSFTAMAGTDVVHIGTDYDIVSSSLLTTKDAFIDVFTLKAGLVNRLITESSPLSTVSSSLDLFTIVSKIITLNSQASSSNVSFTSASLDSFILESKVVVLETYLDTSEFSITSSTVSEFEMKETLITISSYGVESVELSTTSASLDTFTIS